MVPMLRKSLLSTVAGFGLLMAASPSWAASSLSCSIQNILAGTCASGSEGGAGTFSFGDKRFSTTAGAGFLDSDDVIITDTGLNNIYAIQFNLNTARTTPGALDYGISVLNPNLSNGFVLGQAQANITGGGFGNTSTSTITSSSFAAPGSTTVTNNSTATVVGFNSGVTSATFNQSYTPQGGATPIVSSLGITIDQNAPGEGAPGPLPILGAGAAFGFSRKLRRRVKEAA